MRKAIKYICMLIIAVFVLTACSSNNMEKVYGIPKGYENGDYYGNLNIEDIGMHLNIYCADILSNGNKAQEITDAENSAAYFQYGYQFVIADHDYQGFFKILNVKEGMTAYIEKNGGEKEHYKCICTADGHNYSEMYVDTASFSNKNIDEGFPDGLIDLSGFKNSYLVMYTCNGSTEDIYITFWEKQ